MGILSNDIYNDDWRVEFGMYIMGLHTDPSQERFDTINSICSKHLKRNDRRLNWKSNRYLAIAPPNDDQWKDYKGAKIIIAADEELLSAGKAACSEQDTMDRLPFKVTPDDVAQALRAVDAYTKQYLNSHHCHHSQM